VIYGVGMYGCGFIGKVHVYGYLNLPLFYSPPALETKLVGVCTSQGETARIAKEQIGFEFATTDYRELLERDDIHIVHCCTPNHLHRDFLIDAIRAGKHIYCEKPIALNSQEAKQILSVAKEEGYSGKFQMTHQYRYLPATLRAKQLMDEGFLGDLFGFRAVYLHSGYVDPNRCISWRLDADRGGSGALGDLGTHVLDLMYHLLGPYEQVTALQHTFIKERPDGAGMCPVKVDDVTIGMVQMKQGGIGSVEAWRVATGTEDDLRFEIHGSKGAMRFNLMEPNWLEVYDLRDRAEPIGGDRGWKKISTVQRYPKPAGFPGPKFPIGWIRAHMECLHSFLKAIAEDSNTSPSLEEGVYIAKVHDAMAKSAQDGSWIRI
jgi:predicted dehydrogenase